MKLHELKPAAGSNVAAKRKGRGHGSGNGKTAGYGELTKALTVQLAAYTATAKEKIEKAGGKAEVI